VPNGSNLIARLSFPTIATQSSAFVMVGVDNISANKPAGMLYSNEDGQAAQVVVVNDLPLLLATSIGSTRTLQLYGRVGTSYQLQSSTNLLSPNSWWSPVTSYAQTNILQSLIIDGSSPFIFYRLKQ
jgi:hypothetical protein